MQYDFETLNPQAGKTPPFIRTTHTHTAEHPEYLNFGVAEMKFALLPEIAEAVSQAARAGTLGYVEPGGDFHEAVAGWQRTQHDWSVERSWYRLLYGVVPGIGMALRAFTQPGDGVIVQTPIYPPFLSTVRLNGRRLVENRLVLRGNQWEMDLEELERQAADPRTTALILCSPHNPTGRVWTREELERLAAICRTHGVYVISDEIHADLTLPGVRHIVFSRAAGGARHTVLCAPSKTFSIPGMACAFCFTPDDADRGALNAVAERDMGEYNNALGILACGTAYRCGARWLAECREVIAGNDRLLREAVRKYLPSVRVYDAQGTYLRWMDLSALRLDRPALEALFERAHVGAQAGADFDLRENGCIRFNLACPARFIEPAVRRLAENL